MPELWLAQCPCAHGDAAALSAPKKQRASEQGHDAGQRELHDSIDDAEDGHGQQDRRQVATVPGLLLGGPEVRLLHGGE
jgi:hypothetical protein